MVQFLGPETDIMGERYFMYQTYPLLRRCRNTARYAEDILQVRSDSRSQSDRGYILYYWPNWLIFFIFLKILTEAECLHAGVERDPFNRVLSLNLSRLYKMNVCLVMTWRTVWTQKPRFWMYFTCFLRKLYVYVYLETLKKNDFPFVLSYLCLAVLSLVTSPQFWNWNDQRFLSFLEDVLTCLDLCI